MSGVLLEKTGDCAALKAHGAWAVQLGIVKLLTVAAAV